MNIIRVPTIPSSQMTRENGSPKKRSPTQHILMASVQPRASASDNRRNHVQRKIKPNKGQVFTRIMRHSQYTSSSSNPVEEQTQS